MGRVVVRVIVIVGAIQGLVVLRVSLILLRIIVLISLIVRIVPL